MTHWPKQRQQLHPGDMWRVNALVLAVPQPGQIIILCDGQVHVMVCRPLGSSLKLWIDETLDRAAMRRLHDLLASPIEKAFGAVIEAHPDEPTFSGDVSQ